MAVATIYRLDCRDKDVFYARSTLVAFIFFYISGTVSFR